MENMAVRQVVETVPTGIIHNNATNVLGVRVDDVSIDALIERVADAVAGGERLIVVNANAHLVMLAQRRPWLRALFDRADIAFCDGAGVQFAFWLLAGRKPNRHTPPQWIDRLADRLAAHHGSVFWLGGSSETARVAAERLAGRAGVTTAGVHHGFFDTAPGSAENEAVIAAINAARPDLLLLNMGMPRQEQWLAENWHRLNARVAITAGALVDHVAGRVRRPPLWVANAGLEWAVRLAIEPRRLWRRYVLGLPKFAALVALQKARSAMRA
jgi:N-acetylglucosaminyldiphosphoundecaprenol N-acetyl-beta-D-mannosaminyltransferase